MTHTELLAELTRLREQLPKTPEQALLLDLESSNGREIVAAAGVLGILVGTLHMRSAEELLRHIAPFGKSELGRIDAIERRN